MELGFVILGSIVIWLAVMIGTKILDNRKYFIITLIILVIIFFVGSSMLVGGLIGQPEKEITKHSVEAREVRSVTYQKYQEQDNVLMMSGASYPKYYLERLNESAFFT